MKKTITLLVAFLLVINLSFGCGNTPKKKAQSVDPKIAAIEKIKNHFKNQGFMIIEGWTIESPDKSISVTFPDNYIIVTKEDKSLESVQYLGVHPRINDGISVIFGPLPKNPFRYNMDDKAVEKYHNLFIKTNPQLKGFFNTRKIDGNWFIVTQTKDGTTSFSTSGNKSTEVDITSKLLKEDLMKVVESIKFK